MSQSNNNELSSSILAIIALLGVVAMVEFFVLSMMSGGVGSNQVTDIDGIYSEDSINARIKPVVTLADIRGEGGATQVAAVVETKSAKDLYNGACMACHAAGVGGAPKPGDKAAWESRYADGIDPLLASAINGKGIMPARGGSAYSDDELKQVIEYMLAESGLMEAAAEPAAKPAPAKKAVEEKAAAKPAASNDVDLAAGKNAYASACFACHDSGAIGAPKLGDAAGWSARKDKGLEGLTSSAISGLGAMPPKGGAGHLSDAEIKNIVGYMLSKI